MYKFYSKLLYVIIFYHISCDIIHGSQLTRSQAAAILGLPINAEPDEAKKKFYKLALKHHPDKGGNQEQFKLINNAYEVMEEPYSGSMQNIYSTSSTHNNSYRQSSTDQQSTDESFKLQRNKAIIRSMAQSCFKSQHELDQFLDSLRSVDQTQAAIQNIENFLIYRNQSLDKLQPYLKKNLNSSVQKKYSLGIQTIVYNPHASIQDNRKKIDDVFNQSTERIVRYKESVFDALDKNVQWHQNIATFGIAPSILEKSKQSYIPHSNQFPALSNDEYDKNIDTARDKFFYAGIASTATVAAVAGVGLMATGLIMRSNA